MYVLAPNQITEKFPYSIGELRKDNPQVSFPANPSAETLASYNVFPVVSTGSQHDPVTQVAEQSGCLFSTERNRWETAWVVRDKTAEELQAEAYARAKQELLATDWSDLPSVRNTAIEPHLINGAAFDTYRAALRAIVVGPPTTVSEWPVRPDAVWFTATP